MSEGFLQQASLVQQAAALRLSALSIVEGMHSGTFRSLFKGQGIEFAGVRDYLRGDDIRSIDWNVTARMGKPFVKIFEEDRELTVFLVMDRSLSMHTGSGSVSRLYTSSLVGALIAFAAEQSNSPLGGVFFDGDIGFSSAPKLGRSQVMMMIKQLDNQNDRNNHTVKGSVLAKALTGASQLLKNRSLVVVVSDFRTDGYDKQLARLGLKHDVLAVRITDPLDTRLPSVGSIPFEDPETGLMLMLPTTSPTFARQWKQANRDHLERWKNLCLKRGVFPLVIATNSEPALELTRFFSTRERRLWQI